MQLQCLSYPLHYEGCIHIIKNSDAAIFCEMIGTSVEECSRLAKTAGRGRITFIVFLITRDIPHIRSQKYNKSRLYRQIN